MWGWARTSILFITILSITVLSIVTRRAIAGGTTIAIIAADFSQAPA
jgi:hypothetical protein